LIPFIPAIGDRRKRSPIVVSGSWRAGGKALALGGLVSVLLAGCVTLTAEPRAVLERSDGTVEIQTLACGRNVSVAASSRDRAARGLDPASFRLLTWNIHKQGDRGWQQDLSAFAAGSDVLLLQETVLDASLQQMIDDAGMRWVMASSFIYANIDTGVLTASRVEPLASCTQRVVEPLLQLPKSAVISWFPLRGEATTLAVVNAHAINFSLSLGAYRAQFDAIVDALADHAGPIVLAGDLNTWTTERVAVVDAAARRLGLTEIAFTDDRRRLFFGHQLDHIYTRGLDVVASSAIAVTSSDHNPVMATLRFTR
jgi:endonuclease/exonuclease/phosphatase (EEP) superfamily protein YafD